jgi:hypothetical protein
MHLTPVYLRLSIAPEGGRMRDAVLNRRQFLASATCAACSALAEPTSAQEAGRHFDGCFISPAGFAEYRSQRQGVFSVADGLFAKNRHFRTTGDRSLDRDLDRALAIVADLFDVNPAFGFYDPTQFKNVDQNEAKVMNAFATQEDTDIPGTKGTVGFGIDLFHGEFFDHDSTGTSLIAIVAHEFGHILQGNRGYLHRIRIGYPRKSEINADYLAGYFLGTRKLKRPSMKFERAGDLFARLGRSGEGDSKRSHGNIRERLDAAEAGFRVAYVEKKSLNDAVQAGLEYIEA